MMKWQLGFCIPILLVALAFGAGCASKKPAVAKPADQEAALRGLDIAQAPPTEGLIFQEPSPEDAATFKEVHFDFDKSDIKATDKPTLDGIATWMINHPDAQIQVEGHCDDRGTKEYNLALGERRSLSVRTYLTGAGVNPDRIQTISYGEDRPLCTEQDEPCWSRNRRAHFLVNYGGATAAPAAPAPAAAREKIEETTVVAQSVPPAREEETMANTDPNRGRSMNRFYY